MGVKGTQQYMHVMMVSVTCVILMSPFFWDVLLVIGLEIVTLYQKVEHGSPSDAVVDS
jgi:hypothetical protein